MSEFAYTLCYRTSASSMIYNPGVYLYESDDEIAERIREYGKNAVWIILRSRTDNESEALYESGTIRPEIVFEEPLGNTDPVVMVSRIRAVK